MTPAARYAAAIDVLDRILAGTSAEQSLSGWGRSNRFAGSKDRAAIRDHVFDVLRAKKSLAFVGQGETGRALIIGLLLRDGVPLADVFGLGAYGPEPLTEAEALLTMPSATALPVDLPDWLWDHWQDSLGTQAEPVADTLRSRAPVWLRVNLRKTDVVMAAAMLIEDGVETVASDDVATALRVVANERRVKNSRAYLDGFVELQDISSQRAMLSLNIEPGTAVLDYCAGGGGKALAIAAKSDADISAHDIDPRRMKDLPGRADRAGVNITLLPDISDDKLHSFDMVLCDAPCSGSGTWRRTPEAKWTLTREKLESYAELQASVLHAGAQYVREGGRLVYATCSVLKSENEQSIARFLDEHSGWSVAQELKCDPSAQADGFFMVVLIGGKHTL